MQIPCDCTHSTGSDSLLDDRVDEEGARGVLSPEAPTDGAV
jgi:hypothetical protein